MRLTKKKAIQISIELWTWLAETGADKWRWPGWKEYGEMSYDCALCVYSEKKGKEDSCESCPLTEQFGGCCTFPEYPAFANWSFSRTVEDRKKWASAFLVQLKELR